MSRASRDAAERLFQLDSLDLGVMTVVHGPRHQAPIMRMELCICPARIFEGYSHVAECPQWTPESPKHRAEPTLKPVEL